MNSRSSRRRHGVFILRAAVDLDTIDDLARLALQVKRSEKRLTVLAAPQELVRLIEAVGLADVVGVDPSLRSAPSVSSEVGREAEPSEQ